MALTNLQDISLIKEDTTIRAALAIEAALQETQEQAPNKAQVQLVLVEPVGLEATSAKDKPEALASTVALPIVVLPTRNDTIKGYYFIPLFDLV